MRLKSWVVTGLVSVGCAALSACVNLVYPRVSSGAQSHLMALIHIGAALLGSGLLVRFIQGSSKALNGPTYPSTVGTGVVARVGTIRVVVPGKSAFFSATRCFQLLGFIICLMIQFAVAADPLQPQDLAPAKFQTPSHSLAT